MSIVVNSRFLCQPLTGIQRFAIEISLRLKEHYQEDIIFVAPADIMQKEIAERLNVKIIGTHQGQLWEQWDLLKYLNGLSKPLLLCLSGGAPIFYKNLVFTLHDIVYVRFPQSYSFAYRLFYRLIMPPVLRHAKKVITVSEFSKKEISSYYKVSTDKIEVVNNAASTIFDGEYNGQTYKEKQVTYLYFLAVSSPAFHKNFEFLIESFLHADLPKDVQLHIVGKIDNSLYRSGQLAEKVANNERVKFLGRISDEELKDLYANALAFVFPSLYEGFGIPVLEAQACNCLVLSSDAASLPEVLRDSALYFSPAKNDELGKLFWFVLNEDNKRAIEDLKRQGIGNVKRFGWEKSTDNMIHLIDTLA